MDVIEIKGIALKGIIGIKEWEQQLPQDIILDLQFTTNAQQASLSDSIADTIDYQAITEFCIQFIEETKVGLIETLAEKLTQALLTQFNLPWLKLCLHKPFALPQAKDVCITIERHYNEQ